MNQDNNQVSQVLNIIFSWDKSLRTIERKFNRDFDLTINQCRIILHIQDKRFVELSYINSWLNVDKSTTTRMIRPLLVSGFVEKFYQFGDKRKIYLRISEQGLEKVNLIKQEFDQLALRVIRVIPAGKRDLTFQMVNEFIKSMHEF
ncbi:MAG: MarR family winged helix-turn-helix transcriptional regulator [Chitinophagales bacterium]|jgi:DNA-binding MarR family transcriptional regulator|nr:MarR family winged helix-turn-helix transcriptional regulator [Chitinophagales bacterium]